MPGVPRPLRAGRIRGATLVRSRLPPPFSGDDLAAALQATPIPGDPFVVWPTASQLDWHLERERIYTELLTSESVIGVVLLSIVGALLVAAAAFYLSFIESWPTGPMMVVSAAAYLPVAELIRFTRQRPQR